MSRILLDQNLPVGLRTALSGHQVETAARMGWGALENGKLLAVAEGGGFEILMTADKNLEYQQNMIMRKIAVVVLSDNYWPTLRYHIDAIRAALVGVQPGTVMPVTLPRRILRRRPFEPTGMA